MVTRSATRVGAGSGGAGRRAGTSRFGCLFTLLIISAVMYFGVNAVGARIWSLLPPAAGTFEEMCAILAREYTDVSVERLRRDVQAFLDHLIESGLATESSRGSKDGSPDAHTADKGSS